MCTQPRADAAEQPERRKGIGDLAFEPRGTKGTDVSEGTASTHQITKGTKGTKGTAGSFGWCSGFGRWLTSRLRRSRLTFRSTLPTVYRIITHKNEIENTADRPMRKGKARLYEQDGKSVDRSSVAL